MSFLTRVAVVCAALGCGAPCVAQTLNIQAGSDYWRTQSGSVFFGGAIPPIPANFFGPGSDPFLGTVQLVGNPVAPGTSNADTIVKRNADVGLAAPVSSGGVPIQILALELKSINPITITYNSGQTPQQWNVNIGLSPTPSNGTMNLTRTQAGGGTFSAGFTIMPKFTFTPVQPSGVPLVYTAGAPSVSTQGQVQWVTTPFTAPPIPTSGPNFYSPPGTPWTLFSSGGLQQVLVPAVGADCNGNGVIDSTDVANGTSVDWNLNGIPDECETKVTHVYQDSFPDGSGGWLLRHSDRGEIRVSVVDPAEDQVRWLTIGIPGRWIVYNFPITETNGAGSTTEHTVPFRVGTPGVDQVQIELVELHLTSQPFPIPLAPPPPLTAPVIFTIPVIEHPLRFGLIGQPNAGPVLPFAGIDFTYFDSAGQPKEIFRRREVPGVSERTNECAPGAATRSLAWMRDQYCITYPAGAQTTAGLMMQISEAMGYTYPNGVPNAQTASSGISDWLALNGLDDRLGSMSVEDGNPDLLVDALKAGCDVVGIMYFLNPDGSDKFSHAVTVVGGSRCGTRVIISFRDDLQGGDSQNDGQPDDADHFKAGVIAQNPNPPGGWMLTGYGPNRWAGFIKICPTEKVKIDAANKWNTSASGSMTTGGLSMLISNIVGGAAVSAQDRMNLLKWSCNLVDTLEFASHQIGACTTPASATLVSQLLARAKNAKAAIWVYLRSGNPMDLADAAMQVGPGFNTLMAALQGNLDCNHNGKDDAQEIAAGTAQDANHDCVIDDCECLADWNHDGVKNVADIFAYLSDWFHGGGDFNQDGQHTVSDIFAFLAAWFAGC